MKGTINLSSWPAGSPKMSTIKDRLRDARTKAGLTQVELAKMAKTTQQAVEKIENGVTTMPRSALLKRLADALQVSPAWLAFGVEEIDKLSKEAIDAARLFDNLSPDQRAAILTILKSQQKP